MRSPTRRGKQQLRQLQPQQALPHCHRQVPLQLWERVVAVAFFFEPKTLNSLKRYSTAMMMIRTMNTVIRPMAAYFRAYANFSPKEASAARFSIPDFGNTSATADTVVLVTASPAFSSRNIVASLCRYGAMPHTDPLY